MNNKIKQLYLQPNTIGFKTLNHLNKKHTKIICISLMFFIVYFSTMLILQHQEYQQLQLENIQYEENIKQKNVLLSTLLNKQKERNAKDKTLSKLSQNLEQVFKNYQAEVESIQWNIEDNRSISISVNQNANKIFTIIHELTGFQMLRFQELTLTKTDQHRFIQLNATLQLVE